MAAARRVPPALALAAIERAGPRSPFMVPMLRLRVQDIDFGVNQNAVRDVMGGRDRVTTLPAVANGALAQGPDPRRRLGRSEYSRSGYLEVSGARPFSQVRATSDIGRDPRPAQRPPPCYPAGGVVSFVLPSSGELEVRSNSGLKGHENDNLDGRATYLDGRNHPAPCCWYASRAPSTERRTQAIVGAKPRGKAECSCQQDGLVTEMARRWRRR